MHMCMGRGKGGAGHAFVYARFHDDWDVQRNCVWICAFTIF